MDQDMLIFIFHLQICHNNQHIAKWLKISFENKILKIITFKTFFECLKEKKRRIKYFDVLFIESSLTVILFLIQHRMQSNPIKKMKFLYFKLFYLFTILFSYFFSV